MQINEHVRTYGYTTPELLNQDTIFIYNSRHKNNFGQIIDTRKKLHGKENQVMPELVQLKCIPSSSQMIETYPM